MIDLKEYTVDMPENIDGKEEYIEIWETVIKEPMNQILTEDARDLVDNISKIGGKNAKNLPDYKKDLFEYLFRWVNGISEKATTNLRHNEYNGFVSQATNLEERKGMKNELKGMLPIIYVIWLTIFLSLSITFGITFCYGIINGVYFIGPWTHLMLLVATVGLLVTVLVAIGEWRRVLNAKRGEKR